MGAWDGATKKSLFIQVRTYPQTDLIVDLEHIRTYHRDSSRDDFIHNVVLDEIGDEFGVLHPNVFQLLPYLPGGSKRTFDNVFVGSHFVNWQGTGSAYDEGMRNGGHRWANLGLQRALWQSFANIAIGPWHGYINHEGVLDFLDDHWLRQCYEAYLIQSRRDLDSVGGPGKALLWSPAIWSGKPLTAAEETGVMFMFSNVAAYAPPGVTWLHFQDMMGRGRKDITKWDVKQWYSELARAHSFASLRVNMELFDRDAQGNLVPEDDDVVQAREDWYESQGIPVGASWELRWWMSNHAEL